TTIIETSFYLALQIDSSAAYDRRKPARGFRRWKALPEVKDTTPHLRMLMSDEELNRAAAIQAFFAQ
ncbi:unnamed protein product, partial [Rotaria magnacalcarata]